MRDLIDRQTAIEAVMGQPPEPHYPSWYADQIKELPSAQPEQTNCDYCHEDSDGYVIPLEKNCHVLVRRSPLDGWILSVKYGAWRKNVPIKFCPMCGRGLKHG